MRIQRTSQYVTAAIVVLSVLAIACAFVARRYRVEERDAYEATGDRRHLDAFQREVEVDRNRDLAVAGLKQLELTAEELGLLEKAKRNSDDLIRLEQKAFAAAEKNDVSQAIAIVYGPEYEAAKASIMGPIAECRVE